MNTNDTPAPVRGSGSSEGLGGDATHELQELIETLIERDKNALADLNSFYGAGPTIEQRIALADARANDALAAVAVLARYIMKREKAHPLNALAHSPAGSRSSAAQGSTAQRGKT